MINRVVVMTALVVVLAGCASTKNQHSAVPQMVYPGAEYRFSHRIRFTTEKELGFHDPFLTEKVLAVEYWYRDGMNDVRDYYEKLLPSLGWEKVRGFLVEEQTLCGGDWVGVYRNGNRMFKIHACGHERIPADVDLTKSEVKGQYLTYYFYKTDPKAVLGKDYKQRRNITARTYPVRRDMFVPLIDPDTGKAMPFDDSEAALTKGVREFFESCGVTFPPGTWVRYDKKRQRLTVRQTPENFNLVEGILGQFNSSSAVTKQQK